MKWFQLLSMTCMCGAKKQFAGNNRPHALGLAGSAGWKHTSQHGLGDRCPECIKFAREYDANQAVRNTLVTK